MNFDSVWLIMPAAAAGLLLIQLAVKLFPKPVKKRKPALPGLGWKIIYTDNVSAKERRKPDVVYGKLLTDPRYFICGKPDFIYSNGRQLIPVELKSGKTGENPDPREGDLMQLAVYFFLAEAEYGIRPRKGFLIYGDAMFEVRNTRSLRNELIETVNEMRDMLDHPEVDPEETGTSFAKCRYCVCRGTVCEANE